MLKFTCPHCSQRISADDSTLGEEVTCPRCDQPFTAAQPASIEPARFTSITPPVPSVPQTQTTLKIQLTFRQRLNKVAAKVFHAMFGVFIAIFIISFFVPSAPPPNTVNSKAASQPTPPKHSAGNVTVGGYVASPSEEVFNKAVKYANQKDKEALGQLLSSGLLIELKDGIPVEIMDTKVFRGMVKIRPRGSIVEVWTFSEAIRNE